MASDDNTTNGSGNDDAPLIDLNEATIKKLVAKGKRKGVELTWADLLSGDAGFAAALQASVARL